MSVSIQIPTALRSFAGGQASVDVTGSTVGEALNGLTAAHPPLQKHLFAADGSLRSFVNLYVNEEDIRHQQGLDTPVADGTSILIVPSIAGGVEAIKKKSELPDLTGDELARYNRHLILPEVGVEGQRQLKQARVLMIGTGGLGAPLGMYLAAAGIGTIGVVDFDVVDASNLQRQIIHGTRDVGRPKIESARDCIQNINPHVHVEMYETRLTSDNALDIIREYDVVVDGTDNFPTRYLVNDACVLLGKPNVYGSIFRFEGQASVFWAEKGACYRCLYPEPPPPGLVPSCAEGGVLGVLPGIIGCIQANETIKLIIGQGEPLINRLLLFDALGMRFRELKLRKDPNCPVCGENPTVTELIDYEMFCGIGGPTETEVDDGVEHISPTDLKQRIDAGQNVQLIDVREPHEHDIARIPGATLVPPAQILAYKDKLDANRETVLFCRTGPRSINAIQQLQEAGFGGRMVNLKGGILAWADDVDPSLTKY